MGIFCDAECSILFTKTDVTIFDSQGTIIMRGMQELHGAKMWWFNLPNAAANNAAAYNTIMPSPIMRPNVIPPDDVSESITSWNAQPPPAVTTIPAGVPPPAATTIIAPMMESIAPVAQPRATPVTPPRSNTFHCKAYDLPSVGALIEYHHATLGSPVKSELLKAIKKGHLCSFPRLTYSNAARYCLENATPTVMGHMTQVRKGLRSTKPQQLLQYVPPSLPSIEPCLPTTPIANQLSNKLHIFTLPLSTIFTNDMGRFPVKSASSNSYIMLAYHVGANVILIQPFKSKADAHRIPAYNTIMERLKSQGISVDLHILDNEASAAYIDCITNKWKCEHQKIPPNMHRRNIAERMICTFKAHLLSILAGWIHSSHSSVGISYSTKRKSPSTYCVP